MLLGNFLPARVNIFCYYMAVSHNDWDLPNLRLWLAEIDIESGLDFPIRPASRPIILHFAVKKLQTKMQKF